MVKIRKILRGQFSKLKGYSKKLNRAKGGLTIVEILVILAVFLIVTYPLYKDLISGFFTTVQAWFTTNTGSIFK